MQVLKRFFYATAIFFAVGHVEANTDMVALLSRIDSYLIDKSARYEATMTVVRGKKELVYEISMWTKGRNFVTRTHKPIKSKGQIFLFKDGGCWIYYPSIDKTVRSAPNAKLLGGDFSFIDIASIDLQNDYVSHLEVIDEAELNDMPFAGEGLVDSLSNGSKVVSIAIKGKKVVNPKVVSFIDKEGRPLRMDIFAFSGQRLGVLCYSDYTVIGGKMRPQEMVMRTTLQTLNFTKLTYTKADFGVSIPDKYFSVIYMKNLSLGE